MPQSVSLRDIGATEGLEAVRTQLERQVAHWTTAASRLEVLENLASAEAWLALERYLGVAVRERLTEAVQRLRPFAAVLRNECYSARSAADLERVQRRLLDFRHRYTRVELCLDFYGDCTRTRTSPEISVLLRACDLLARRSMQVILEPLGKPTPPVLCYLDKGVGASILKAGLRLWDGSTESPAAAIKIVWHNLFRPSSLVHETGHQVAHIVGWNEELAAALETRLAPYGREIAKIWAGWATELAGDAFAFVHMGYAAVAALHDVVAGDAASVFRFDEWDPHPISYLRVLLGVEMCRRFFGSGPWDALADAWIQAYPMANAEAGVRRVVRAPLLPDVAEVCLAAPMRAFGGRSLAGWIDPRRVSPSALVQLEKQAGAALFVSHHWIWTESLRLTALTGYRMATQPEQMADAIARQRAWMLRLGALLAEA
jgi:hypothetical protein